MAKRKPRSDRNHLVYMITNTLTNEKYIGITVMRGQAKKKSMKLRWEGHLYGAFVEGRDYTFPEHLRQYAPVMEECSKWYKEKTSYLRKMNKMFKKEILEVVRGKSNAHKREVELINTIKPELNDKKQRG